jgi:DNA-binding NtrC family response regulator
MSHPVLEGKRVAVIEDEVPIGAVLEIMLGELGCVYAGSARTLKEAMSLADEAEVDAVLLDYKLKGEPSDPAAQRFMTRGIRVILTTGVEQIHLPATLQDCAIVRKPYGLENLEQGLVRALS